MLEFARMPAALDRLAKIITVLNLKGGVGKTHTIWLLVSVCQERSLRVLALDTDTQGNLSNSFLSPDEQRPGIDALFHPGNEQDILSLIRRTTYSHIDIVPANPQLARFDLSDQREWEKADLHFSLVDAMGELRSQYDYIVFDCPPRLSLVSFAALCASDHVIIPMEAADWGAQGIMQVTEAIRYVHQHYNRRLQLLGYLVSRFKRARAYQQSYLKQLREHFGSLAFDTVLPDLAQFEKSVTDRIPITLHAPKSEEAGIARAFFDEVERRTQRVSAGSRAGREAGIRRGTPAAASPGR
jgi:chromosome partitioning protein